MAASSFQTLAENSGEERSEFLRSGGGLGGACYPAISRPSEHGRPSFSCLALYFFLEGDPAQFGLKRSN